MGVASQPQGCAEALSWQRPEGPPRAAAGTAGAGALCGAPAGPAPRRPPATPPRTGGGGGGRFWAGRRRASVVAPGLCQRLLLDAPLLALGAPQAGQLGLGRLVAHLGDEDAGGEGGEGWGGGAYERRCQGLGLLRARRAPLKRSGASPQRGMEVAGAGRRRACGAAERAARGAARGGAARLPRAGAHRRAVAERLADEAPRDGRRRFGPRGARRHELWWAGMRQGDVGRPPRPWRIGLCTWNTHRALCDGPAQWHAVHAAHAAAPRRRRRRARPQRPIPAPAPAPGPSPPPAPHPLPAARAPSPTPRCTAERHTPSAPTPAARRQLPCKGTPRARARRPPSVLRARGRHSGSPAGRARGRWW